jgi:hypothetical protein
MNSGKVPCLASEPGTQRIVMKISIIPLPIDLSNNSLRLTVLRLIVMVAQRSLHLGPELIQNWASCQGNFGDSSAINIRNWLCKLERCIKGISQVAVGLSVHQRGLVRLGAQGCEKTLDDLNVKIGFHFISYKYSSQYLL